MQCGNKKATPWEACPKCGFDPTTNEDALVKSVFLSVGRFSKASAKARYRKALDGISATIERGEAPPFEEGELMRLKRQKALVERVPASMAWEAVVRLFLPAIGIIALLFVLGYIIRALR